MGAEGGAEKMLKDELVRAEIWRDGVNAGLSTFGPTDKRPEQRAPQHWRTEF